MLIRSFRASQGVGDGGCQMCDSVCASIRAAPSTRADFKNAGIGTSQARPWFPLVPRTGSRPFARRRETASETTAPTLAKLGRARHVPSGGLVEVDAIWIWLRFWEASEPPR